MADPDPGTRGISNPEAGARRNRKRVGDRLHDSDEGSVVQHGIRRDLGVGKVSAGEVADDDVRLRGLGGCDPGSPLTGMRAPHVHGLASNEWVWHLVVFLYLYLTGQNREGCHAERGERTALRQELAGEVDLSRKESELGARGGCKGCVQGGQPGPCLCGESRRPGHARHGRQHGVRQVIGEAHALGKATQLRAISRPGECAGDRHGERACRQRLRRGHEPLGERLQKRPCGRGVSQHESCTCARERCRGVKRDRSRCQHGAPVVAERMTATCEGDRSGRIPPSGQCLQRTQTRDDQAGGEERLRLEVLHARRGRGAARSVEGIGQPAAREGRPVWAAANRRVVEIALRGRHGRTQRRRCAEPGIRNDHRTRLGGQPHAMSVREGTVEKHV